MENKEDKLCVICEVMGNEVKAEFFAKFNGDLMPVCSKHNDYINKRNAQEFLNKEDGK
jgi:hypothetical protein